MPRRRVSRHEASACDKYAYQCAGQRLARVYDSRLRAPRAERGAYHLLGPVDFRLYEGALLLAKFYVRQGGWIVRSVEDHRWLRQISDVPRASLRYYRGAKSRGAYLKINSYPRRTVRRKHEK
jgi:hypothetical protein